MTNELSEKMYSEGLNHLFPATKFLPFIAQRGKGIYLYDLDGNRYFDLNSGQFCLVLGYNDKKLLKIISRQCSKIIHTSTSCIAEEVFAAASNISEILSGGLTNIIFLSTGAEAVECAIRYSKVANNRNGVICAKRGYHGLTLATQALTLGGNYANPRVDKTLYLPTPDHFSPENTIQNCINEATSTFAKHGNDSSCLIIEPIISVGGILEMPIEYMDHLRKLCTQYGVNLIFDECQTGFGRTGEWFAYQRLNIAPDILVTAKAMGLGFPVSMVAFTDEIKNIVTKSGVSHYSSHQNDPLAAITSTYLISVIRSKGLLQSNKRNGDYFKKRYNDYFSKSRLVSSLRGVGLIMGFDIVPEIPDEKCREISDKIIANGREEGILLQTTNKGRTFRLLPAYIITEKQIDQFLKSLYTAIKKVEVTNVL